MSSKSRPRSKARSACCAIVWCYCSTRGIPVVFDPIISNEIERRYSMMNTNGQTNCNPFPVDSTKSPQWANYVIDLQTLQVVSTASTGDSYKICRQVCTPDSAFSQGYKWVVEGDGRTQWITYDFDASHLIEHMFSASKSNSSHLDLRNKTGQPYIIDIQSKTQTNTHTGKKRKIKRDKLSQQYTLAPFSSSAASGNTSSGGKSYPQPSKKLKTTAVKKYAVFWKQKSSATHLPGSASSSASSSLSLPSLSSLPLNPICGGAQCEQITESLPVKKSIRISRENKATEIKNVSNIEKYMAAVTLTSDIDEDCIICMENLSEDSGFGEGGKHDQAKDVVNLVTCGHLFHKLCLSAMYKSDHKEDCLECPSCKTMYGEKYGNCPPGQMLWEIMSNISIPGYEGYNVIRMNYDIAHGRQCPGDPNPGARFRAAGFPREGFLPDNNKGRKVLKLLMEAFRRKLMFTIGTSVTTGQNDTVTWNEIHLKTEAISNYHGHGYPDSNYLDNVLMELALHGIREETLDDPSAQ